MSARQREVLPLVAMGFDNEAIATVLGIGVETVKTHMAIMLVRLGANNRAHAVHIAHLRGWLS